MHFDAASGLAQLFTHDPRTVFRGVMRAGIVPDNVDHAHCRTVRHDWLPCPAKIASRWFIPNKARQEAAVLRWCIQAARQIIERFIAERAAINIGIGAKRVDEPFLPSRIEPEIRSIDRQGSRATAAPRSFADIRPHERVNGPSDNGGPFAVGDAGASHDRENGKRPRQDPARFGGFLQSQLGQGRQFVRDRVAAARDLGIAHFVFFREAHAQKRQLLYLEERFNAALRAAANHKTYSRSREILDAPDESGASSNGGKIIVDADLE